jgi:hypothetical protein
LSSRAAATAISTAHFASAALNQEPRRRNPLPGREMPVGVSSDSELKPESRSAPWGGFDPDSPVIAIHNSPTNGQPDAGS